MGWWSIKITSVSSPRREDVFVIGVPGRGEEGWLPEWLLSPA